MTIFKNKSAANLQEQMTAANLQEQMTAANLQEMTAGSANPDG